MAFLYLKKYFFRNEMHETEKKLYFGVLFGGT